MNSIGGAGADDVLVVGGGAAGRWGKPVFNCPSCDGQNIATGQKPSSMLHPAPTNSQPCSVRGRDRNRIYTARRPTTIAHLPGEALVELHILNATTPGFCVRDSPGRARPSRSAEL